VTGKGAHQPTGLALYNRTADDAAATVIRAYSTSFGMASRLLGRRVRGHVRNIYALVRVADEVVDGPAEEAGLDAAERAHLLDDLEQSVAAAMDRGYSADLIVHAFARTARDCGIGADLTAPFFASMRTDLTTAVHDAASHDAYVYGSAEVVGLMCLAAFRNAGRRRPVLADPDLTDAARALGRAFQDVNFLRDRDDDATRLGRDYLDAADESGRAAVLDRVDADLARAAGAVHRLPPDCRRAVIAAHHLFAELTVRLRAAPPGTRRVRVPGAVKAAIVLRATVGASGRGARP
jgi:phytoene/squalene synthetase